ncbi:MULTISPECIES: M48 family metallopeptidase [unclassified Mucilaginibacter]|uniref:M48 family metallopeptidase n=2 Tax=Mucilaginibacter TaxID=423349 RepID=UPI002AC95B30|nr:MULTISPECIES: M48 family metallopeptidase [unclassified Mucilaginibacter]MEB0249412.1 M48 family metallopeptidase [Mucilaginibacter sp. 5B2]MEB0276941.1 M48 family metallopeptidase [Mucilaginibacter sp. 10B2]MEB0302720.1 M48 family metallopeptidase [Mucilaginibacter sp. 5C4]WPX25041.1 M48 family metallopeptidase [Mucilaginibacter sp. 5C4]
MKRMKPLLALAIIAIATYACSTVPLTGRSQLSLVSDDQINPAAAQSYRTLLSDPSTKVINTGTDAQRVKRIGSQLAIAIDAYLKANGYGSQYNYQWEFNLIQSKEINAWCMPGGKVAVYSGILPVTQTDAGLATVMGHEIGHAIAHHSAEALSQQMAVQAGGTAIGVATGNKSQSIQAIIGTLYGVGGQLATLKYSRDKENEADRLGLTFMAMAGYDPRQAVSFWQRMAAQNQGAPPEFLSTHPSDATRIANIQRLVPEAMKYYKGK